MERPTNSARNIGDLKYALSKRLLEQLIDFLRDAESQLKEGERLPLSTEILESSFALYKQLERQHSQGGFTSLVASFAALLRKPTPEFIRSSFASVSTKEVKQWVRENLGTTLNSKRLATYREMKKLNAKRKQYQQYRLREIQQPSQGVGDDQSGSGHVWGPDSCPPEPSRSGPRHRYIAHPRRPSWHAGRLSAAKSGPVTGFLSCQALGVGPRQKSPAISVHVMPTLTGLFTSLSPSSSFAVSFPDLVSFRRRASSRPSSSLFPSPCLWWAGMQRADGRRGLCGVY